MDRYRIIAWLGWVLNLLVAEWIIRKGLKRKDFTQSYKEHKGTKQVFA
jgi:hypothetical protein